MTIPKRLAPAKNFSFEKGISGLISGIPGLNATEVEEERDPWSQEFDQLDLEGTSGRTFIAMFDFVKNT